MRSRDRAYISTTEGDGSGQTINLVVPEGMVLEFDYMQITHNAGENALIQAYIKDPDDTELIRIASDDVSQSAGYALSVPEMSDYTLNMSPFQNCDKRVPFRIPPNHKLVVTVENVLGAGEYIKIRYCYRLLPYTFSSHDAVG